MPESTTPDPRGALRKAMTDKGIMLQTLISWLPPTIELPRHKQSILIVLECQPYRIMSGWYDATLHAFFLDGANVRPKDSDIIHYRSVRLWAPATIDQQ
jgi:hypothetical protein